MNQKALKFDYDEKNDVLTVVMKKNPTHNCHYLYTPTAAVRLSPDESVSAVIINDFLRRAGVGVVDRKRNVFKVCDT